MKKTIYILLLLTLINCSDSLTELGSDYFLKLEGEFSNEVINRKPNYKGIPSDVIRIDFNDDYIIAEQKPNEFDDAMQDEVYKYNEGRKNLYYWIIIKNTNIIIGPLNLRQFENEKMKNKIPSSLKLKKIY